MRKIEQSYYGVNPIQKKIIEIARNMMLEVEEHRLFANDDEMWNAAMSAGNKMVTVGLPYSRFEKIQDLNAKEQRALSHFLGK